MMKKRKADTATTNPLFLFPLGMFFFIISQSAMLARKSANAYMHLEHLAEVLKNTNEIYRKFVPGEFIDHLGKESILDIALGDQAEKTMSILFLDIRSFTAMSEKMKPKENFEFINSFLSEMGPVVRYHGGFIDKYIGDAIMALFPGSICDAVDSAIAMQRQLKVFNENYKNRTGIDRTIAMGIGIHSGPMMLGIIGEHERMESTVISDVVNVASRMEGITKVYKANILITDTAYKTIETSGKYIGNYIDNSLRLFDSFSEISHIIASIIRENFKH